MAKTYLFWDPLEDNVVREYDEAGTVTAEYTTEPELYGNVISQRRQGEYRQFHYDGQGSALAATDENENVTDTFAYTAFGEVTERTGTSQIPFQYIGQKGYYSLSGHIMARRRPYEPATARWLATDPRTDWIRSTNLYSYVANSPVMASDPTGMSPLPDQPQGGESGRTQQGPRSLCSSEEWECIDSALALVSRTIRERGVECFRDLAFCPNGERSACSSDVLAACLDATLKATKYACVERGKAGCHNTARNAGHTDSACAALKSLAALGFSIPRIVDCKPCMFGLPYANDCTECPSHLLYATFTSLCRDRTPDLRSIASYCRTTAGLKQLATLLVHEAAHSCVGLHNTTGKKGAIGEPSCDKCNRNDAYNVDEGFKKCVATVG